jgi:prepilin-type N-terminal cleavage/methylation domain-containing protein
MKKINNKLGFTLIELLVVITIIGILATGAVNVFTTQLQWARDSSRIWDLKTMETAVHSFFSDESEYPTADNNAQTGFTWAIKWFISKELVDPKKTKLTCFEETTPGSPTSSAACEWIYSVADDSFWLTNAKFKLWVRFEKEKNYLNKAKATGKETDGWNSDEFYEVYAGAGGSSGATDSSATAIIVY